MIFAKYPPVMKGKLKVGRIKCFTQIHSYVTGMWVLQDVYTEHIKNVYIF